MFPDDGGSTVHSDPMMLTSATASSMMAGLPSGITVVDFPGAPSLPPPPDSTIIPQGSLISDVSSLRPARLKPRPPLATIEPSDPIDIRSQNPQGPREEPARALLKNVMALRRMNSEANESFGRESRRYTRLGREPSPLLPFIGSPDLPDSCNDLFDFDFASEPEPTDGGARRGSDEENVNPADRRQWCEHRPGDVHTLNDAQRGSSVWEDGENYWNFAPEKTAAASRSDVELSPSRSRLQSIPEFGRLTTPVPKFSIPQNRSPILGTPGSLYDANGFLRCEI